MQEMSEEDEEDASMILVDPRDGGVVRKPGVDTPSDLFIKYIKQYGVCSEAHILPYADFCFEGRGPTGTVMIGVERKTLHDMLNCIHDAHYNAQRIGMLKYFKKSYLLLEGQWKPHDETGILMQGFDEGSHTSWTTCKFRTGPIMYSELYNYLNSVALSGVIVTHSRNIRHSAFNLVQLWHWYQKKWDDHTALREIHRLNLPTLNTKPSLVRKWAADIEEVGVKRSEEAERVFNGMAREWSGDVSSAPYMLATSTPEDWMKISRIGRPTAESIVRQIRGKHKEKEKDNS